MESARNLGDGDDRGEESRESERAGLAASLLKLAQTLRRGSVQASWLMTSEEVSGFRVIRDPETTSLRELKFELAALRGRLEEAILSGAGDTSAIGEARLALAELAAELGRQDPAFDLLTAGFGWAADRIQESGADASQRGELTFSLSQLAVSSAALCTIAQRVLPASPE